jgi:hypothetical protein
MVEVPERALELTVSLRVDVPEPGAARDEGVRVAVTPVGMPLADKATAELKLPERALVIVELPELPRDTVSEVGEALREKLAGAGAVTVRLTVVEFVMPPPMPVTVIGYVPVAAVEATVKVRREVPVPGEAMGLVPKPAVTPVGRPLADKVIAELKPFTAAVVIVDVPALPCTTETEVGEGEMVKLGAVTVRLTVVEFTVLPAVPVTVIGYVPVAVDAATVRVRSEVPVPGEGTGLVAKPAVTPVGRPLVDKVIAELKPFTAVVVIVDVPALPCTTETEVGEAEMVKLGPAGPARALIRAAPFGLPQPLAKS